MFHNANMLVLNWIHLMLFSFFSFFFFYFFKDKRFNVIFRKCGGAQPDAERSQRPVLSRRQCFDANSEFSCQVTELVNINTHWQIGGGVG